MNRIEGEGLSAHAAAVVDTGSKTYEYFQTRIVPFLDHFGVCYELIDMIGNPLTIG